MRVLLSMIAASLLCLGCRADTPSAASDAPAAGASTPSEAPSASADSPEGDDDEAEDPAGDAPDAPRTAPLEAPSGEALGTTPDGVGRAPGDEIPDVTANDADGEAVGLHALAAARGPLLVVFYRGGWCPYCNSHVRALTEAHDDLAERGITPVAVSVDRADAASETKATYDIPFPVLSDPDLAWHEAFRVIHHASDEEVERLKGFGIDLEAASGRDHHKIAIPGVFALDADATVRWAHADADYKKRPTMAQVIEALDALESEGSAER